MQSLCKRLAAELVLARLGDSLFGYLVTAFVAALVMGAIDFAANLGNCHLRRLMSARALWRLVRPSLGLTVALYTPLVALYAYSLQIYMDVAGYTDILGIRSTDGGRTWGFNVMRNIRRKNEQVFWAPIPKAYTLTRATFLNSFTSDDPIFGQVTKGDMIAAIERAAATPKPTRSSRAGTCRRRFPCHRSTSTTSSAPPA
mgnify:CR=1 FL=1